MGKNEISLSFGRKTRRAPKRPRLSRRRGTVFFHASARGRVESTALSARNLSPRRVSSTRRAFPGDAPTLALSLSPRADSAVDEILDALAVALREVARLGGGAGGGGGTRESSSSGCSAVSHTRRVRTRLTSGSRKRRRAERGFGLFHHDDDGLFEEKKSRGGSQDRRAPKQQKPAWLSSSDRAEAVPPAPGRALWSGLLRTVEALQ